jgi:hypothetical protein
MQTDVHKYILYILFYRTEVHVVRNKISRNITYLNLDLEDMICKCIRKNKTVAIVTSILVVIINLIRTYSIFRMNMYKMYVRKNGI